MWCTHMCIDMCIHVCIHVVGGTSPLSSKQAAGVSEEERILKSRLVKGELSFTDSTSSCGGVQRGPEVRHMAHGKWRCGPSQVRQLDATNGRCWRYLQHGGTDPSTDESPRPTLATTAFATSTVRPTSSRRPEGHQPAAAGCCCRRRSATDG